ncbi:MAG: VWA domain-containing protein [Clostridia bacterium]|nr:VWA domain-containing protein [Clostridia bacterium]
MKRSLYRLLSILLALCMLLPGMLMVIAEEEGSVEEAHEQVYIQPVEISASDTQSLSQEETNYYAEVSNELSKDDSKDTVTVENDESVVVYSIKEDDESVLQEFTYTTDESSAMSLTSYAEITLVEDGDTADGSTNTYEKDVVESDEEEGTDEPIDSGTDEEQVFEGQPVAVDVLLSDAVDSEAGTVNDTENAPAENIFFSAAEDASLNAAASNEEYDDEYKNTNQTIITAERLLEMIESGDEFAITFANKLGFGRTSSEIAGNLRTMVTEYHDQVNSGNTSFQEPKFIINGIDIVLNRTIEEVSLTKNDDGTYSAVLNGNGDQTGYRTSVMVDADASVTIVYDQHGEAKIERRVSSGKPTDFVITLDVSGSMSGDRSNAMKSALKVVLDEILQVKENTVSIVFWANRGEAMQIRVDESGITQVFSGADGMTANKLMDAALIDRYGNETGYSLSDATIYQLESLYGVGGGTEPDKGLAQAIDLLKNVELDDGRNVGVMLFTDGEANWYDNEHKTVEYEKQIVEDYGATIVNVSIGDEYDVKNYERYLDPSSDNYYDKDDKVLKDHVLYYNIPKLTDQQLADKVSEMFEIAFEDITTETTELKTETITDGILAAYASQLIQTIPDGFEFVEIKGSDNTVSYQVVGTDSNGNTMISYNLDDIISGKDQVISYCVIPTKAENDIGVTAYADKAETVLHAQPVDRIDVPEEDKTVLIRSTKNGKGQDKPQRANINDDATIQVVRTAYGAETNTDEKSQIIKIEAVSADRWNGRDEVFVKVDLSSVSENDYYDISTYDNSELYNIAIHNTRVLQNKIDEASEIGNGCKVEMPKGEFYFAPDGTYNVEARDYRTSYAILLKNNVEIIGQGQGDTILKPLANYNKYKEATAGIYDAEKAFDAGMYQANPRGMDMFYFNEYADNGVAKWLENVSFKNFTIDGVEACQDTSIHESTGKGFMINLMKNCKWDSVTVRNTDGSGFGVDCPINCHINNCEAINCGKNSGNYGPGGSGFGIGIGYDNAESMIISNCYAEGNGKFGFFFEHQNRFDDKKYTADYPNDNYNYQVVNCVAQDNLYNFGGLKAYNVEYDQHCLSKYTQAGSKIKALTTGGTKSRKDILNELRIKYSDKLTEIQDGKDEDTGIFFGNGKDRSQNCVYKGSEIVVDRDWVLLSEHAVSNWSAHNKSLYADFMVDRINSILNSDRKDGVDWPKYDDVYGFSFSTPINTQRYWKN